MTRGKTEGCGKAATGVQSWLHGLVGGAALASLLLAIPLLLGAGGRPGAAQPPATAQPSPTATPAEAAGAAAELQQRQESLRKAVVRCRGEAGTPVSDDAALQCFQQHIESETDHPQSPEDCQTIRSDAFRERCVEAGRRFVRAQRRLDAEALRVKLGKKVGSQPSPYFLLQAGVVTLSPFKIVEDNGKFILKTDSLSAHGIVQASFIHRWAWAIQGGGDKQRTYQELLKPDDVEARMGFTFLSGDSKDAATVVGSGDLSAEIYAGWNAWRGQRPGGMLYSVNFPEVGITGVTDRNFEDIHTNVFFGPSLVVAAPMTFELLGSSDRLIRFRYRLGWAGYEVPDLVGDSNEVAVDAGNVPKFTHQWAGFANEVEFQLPVLESSYVTASGRLYNGSDPNPWSFQVDYSVPLDQVVDRLVSGLSGALGLDQASP